MRALQVTPAPWPLTDDHEIFYLHNTLDDGTLLVERGQVRRVQQADGLWDVTLAGGGFLGCVDERSVSGRLFTAAGVDGVDARSARCYEQTGTVVHVSVFVDDTDAETAKGAVVQALASVSSDIGTPTAQVALDRNVHVLDRSGRLLAADQPHWKVGTNVYICPAERPAHDAVYELATQPT